jgi:N-acetylglucosamine-6-phosphate deacetylase
MSHVLPEPYHIKAKKLKRMIKITNGNVITPFRVLENGSVLISDGKILEVTQGDIDAGEAIEIDARGQFIAPGFIDIHVHGGGGSDFMDNTVDAFLKIAETHAKYGTTAMVPTTLTCEVEELYQTLSCYEAANKLNIKGAQFLGMHLEGPYFAVNQRGAQDERYIRDPNPAEYKEILRRSASIVRWSAAPELKGALKFARVMRDRGILVALAHTDAVYEEVLEGFENGFSLATHLYSGMSGVTRKNAYRYAGAVESAFIIDNMDVEIIADGIHLPAPLLKLVYKIKGASRTALITDAMRAAGMPGGESVLGNDLTGLKVIVEDGVAKLPDRSAFAGSVATADQLVRTMVNMAGVPLPEALEMITATPARIMGVADRKGALVAGKDADLVIFDDNININTTIVGGEIVYNASLETLFA